MKIPILLVLSFLFHNSSCSSTIVVNNAAPTKSESVPTTENRLTSVVSNQSSKILENRSSQNPKDAVVFDGTNYIKKSGWKVPSRDNTYINEAYRSDTVKGVTEQGHEVKMTTKQYIYKTPWSFSENFNFEGRNLDYMKGNLKCGAFFEMRANGKVFMYTVFVEKVVTPPPSNNDPHEDPTSYQIQDKDGDGIFETLLGDYDEIIVPNWVLK